MSCTAALILRLIVAVFVGSDPLVPVAVIVKLPVAAFEATSTLTSVDDVAFFGGVTVNMSGEMAAPAEVEIIVMLTGWLKLFFDVTFSVNVAKLPCMMTNSVVDVLIVKFGAVGGGGVVVTVSCTCRPWWSELLVPVRVI